MYFEALLLDYDTLLMKWSFHHYELTFLPLVICFAVNITDINLVIQFSFD